MPKFSNKSKKKLVTVHPDLQTLFNAVILHWDCTIVSGLRTTDEQQELYERGRTKPGGIVTYKDGVKNKSKHQLGLAVDVVPYPSLYNDRLKMRDFGNFVLGMAVMLKEYGEIDHDIEWGGHWVSFVDYPHFQI